MDRTYAKNKNKDVNPEQGNLKKTAGRFSAAGSEKDILELQSLAGNQAVRDSLESIDFRPGSGAKENDGAKNVPRTSGRPLEPAVRSDMEEKFGYNFESVRVHTDSEAGDSASLIKAKAYTVSQDIVFGRNRYAPGTAQGKELLAHELAHVVQQRQGGSVQVLYPSGPHEQEADVAAAAIAKGAGFNVQGQTGVGIARKPDDKLGAASAEDLWRLIQGLRGFDAIDPTHAPEASKDKVEKLKKQLASDPKNKELKAELEKAERRLKRSQKRVVKIDPAGKGKPIGQGYSTYAAIQVVDKNGKQVDSAIGKFTSKVHAEGQAIDTLKGKLAGKKYPGGRVMVVVDQVVCGECRKALKQFARELGIGRVDAYYPTRPPIGKKTGRVSPKTAARSSVQKGRTTTLRQDVVLDEPSAPQGPSGKGTKPKKRQSKKTEEKSKKETKKRSGKKSAVEAKQRISTKKAVNTEFQTQGKVIHTDRHGGRMQQPRSQIRRSGRSRVVQKGAGLAEFLPAAMNALQDMAIRHRIAVNMLMDFSKVEKWRRNDPNHIIIAVVSLQEWEHPDPAGQVARAVNYVEFYHGATVAEAEAKAANILRSGVPKGWREVGPFIGIIKPGDDLDDIKEHIEDQEACFIATACYGSHLAAEVVLLREFRDTVLRRWILGAMSIHLYYRISPPIAFILSHHMILRTIMREFVLSTVVWILQNTERSWRKRS